MNIAIYSDVYDQMFSCGQYRILGGDVIDFGGLVVPCIDTVAISIMDTDFSYNDGQTMLISCSAQNQKVDFMLNDKEDVTQSIKSHDSLAQSMNVFNPHAQKKSINGLSSSLVGKNMGEEADSFQERDAFYQLSVSGMQSDSKIDLDARFMTKNDSKQCGAKVINFKDIKEKSEKVKDHD